MSWRQKKAIVEPKIYRNEPGLEVPECPPDSVSCISWSSPPIGTRIPFMRNVTQEANRQMRLAVSSWDGSLRVYNVQCNNMNVQPMAFRMFNIDGPCMSCCLNDGSHVFSASLDGNLRMHDIQNQTTTEIGKHAGPVAKLLFDHMNNHVISGGYDGKLCAWNGQSPHAVWEFQLGGRVRDFCWQPGWIAAIDSSGQVTIANLNSKMVKVLTRQDVNLGHLQWTSVALVPERPPKNLNRMTQTNQQPEAIEYIVIGAIDGRCSVKKINLASDGSPKPQQNSFAQRSWNIKDDKQEKDDFNFGAHPSQKGRSAHPNPPTVQYPVATVQAAQRGLLMTSGGDGYIQMWGIWNRNKVAEIPAARDGWPITAMTIDPWSRYICYAYGYNWAKGYRGVDPMNCPPKLYIKPCPVGLFDQVERWSS